MNGYTGTGPKPNWVVLNEISAGLWPTSSVYRAWVHDVVHALKTNYGYNVILFSPFSNPGANLSAPNSFGVSLGTINTPAGFGTNRQIQFALRYTF